MFLAASGVFISVIGALKFTLSAAPLAILVIFLGLYANRFVAVYEQKWDELTVRRHFYREKLEALVDIPSISDSAYQKIYKSGKKLRLRHYWRNTFYVVSLSGIVCLLIVIGIATGVITPPTTLP